MSNKAVIDIILVEDNPNDAELFARTLKKQNLSNEYVLLKDGAEAIQFLFEQGFINRPKLIVLDLKLPKVDGIEVLRRIKSDPRTMAIPVVVLTSSTEERDLREAYELGVNSYLIKPIKFSELVETVTELGTYWLGRNKLPALYRSMGTP